MSGEQYESLPTENIGIHMIAGSVAGIMEHCVMYPVDSIKTRMQSLAPSPEATYSSLRDGMVKMVSTEGAARTVRGVSAVIAGAGPAHAMYFAAYEGIKAKFKRDGHIPNILADGAAGAGATLLHDAIMVPSEVIKQRMQMYNSPYKSCIDCMCKLYCKEGFSAFYRSYSTQVVMNIPFHFVQVAMYEHVSHSLNPDRVYNPKVHLIAGACAGGIAAALTMPLDMCKTLLNTQEASTLSHLKQTKIVGITSAMKTIYMMQGYRGFFRGLYARVLYQVPGTAISWSVYELFKHHLINYKTSDADNGGYDDHPFKEKLLQEKQRASVDVGTLPGSTPGSKSSHPIGTRFGHEKIYAMNIDKENLLKE